MINDVNKEDDMAKWFLVVFIVFWKYPLQNHQLDSLNAHD